MSVKHRCLSRREALGVAGEEGGLADVVQAQVQHDHTLEANAAASVRRRSVPEAVNVALDVLNVNFMLFCTLNQEGWVVDTLGTRQDFFSSHEHVIGVGPFLVMGVRHGVEGSHLQGKLVKDEEVCVILGLD